MASIGVAIKVGGSTPFQSWTTQGGPDLADYAEQLHAEREAAIKAQQMEKRKEEREVARLKKVVTMPGDLDPDVPTQVGLDLEALPEDVVKEIVHVLRSHPSRQLAAIASGFNVTRSEVGDIAEKYGLQRKHPSKMDGERDKVAKLLKSKKNSVPEIASALGVSKSFVYSVKTQMAKRRSKRG